MLASEILDRDRLAHQFSCLLIATWKYVTYSADYVVVVCKMSLAFSAAKYLVGIKVDIICESHLVKSTSKKHSSPFILYLCFNLSVSVAGLERSD